MSPGTPVEPSRYATELGYEVTLMKDGIGDIYELAAFVVRDGKIVMQSLAKSLPKEGGRTDKATHRRNAHARNCVIDQCALGSGVNGWHSPAHRCRQCADLARHKAGCHPDVPRSHSRKRDRGPSPAHRGDALA